MSVTTASGSSLTAERAGARGDPELALDDREMLDKARMLLEFAGSDANIIDQIVNGTRSLAEPGDTGDVVEFINRQFQ